MITKEGTMNVLRWIGKNVAFGCIFFMLIFTGYSIMNIAEYKGVFTLQPSDLPNTAAGLKANADDIQKVLVVIDYPHLKMTGSRLEEYKTLGMWSEAGDALHGDVAVELNVDLRGVYDHDSKNMSKTKCKAIRDGTPSWSDNWHKLVPGCGQVVEDVDDTGDFVTLGADAYSPKDDADFYKECYKQMKTYNDLQAVLFWVWVVFILGYSMALYMQATNRKSNNLAFVAVTYQKIGTIFVMIMLLMYIVILSMIVDSGYKLYGSKNTCFMKTINTAIAGATYNNDDGDAVSVAAYDWGKLKKYDEGKMFGEGDNAIPTLKPHNMTKDADYGGDKKAVGFDVATLALSCVAFFATCVNAYQKNGALISGVSGGFSDGFIM